MKINKQVFDNVRGTPGIFLFFLIVAALVVAPSLFAAELDIAGEIKATTGLVSDEYAAGTYLGPVIETRGFRTGAAILNAGVFATGATATVTIHDATETQPLITAVTTADVSAALKLTSTAGVKLAILFDGTSQTSPRAINDVYLKMRRVGSPDGEVYCSIEIQSTTTPSGTSLGNSDLVTIDALSTTYEWRRFEWDSAVPIVPSTTYFVVINGMYSTSASSYVELGVDTVSSGGNYYDYTVAWNATTTKSINAYINGFIFNSISGATFKKTASSIPYTGLNTSTDSNLYMGSLKLRSLAPHLIFKLVGETDAVTLGATLLMGGYSALPIDQPETLNFDVE